MKKFAMITIVVLSIANCREATKAQWSALGSDGHIKCYSGGQLIYEGISNGKISTENQSDGWFFKDKKSGGLIRVSGDCLIEN